MRRYFFTTVATIMMYNSGCTQTSVVSIFLNQLGFYTHAPKVAIVSGSDTGKSFYIISANNKDTVFTGKLSEAITPAYSSAETHIADFTAFAKPGKYVLHVDGAGTSYPFNIESRVQQPVAIASLKGYYYQRVSMPLEEKYAGQWARPAGHPDTAVLIHPSAATAQRPSGTVISSPGGWYDAGDYNKYIVNSGITMGTLLSAYEDFPKHFDTLTTNIPESNDAVPDILDEVIYNLRWMLTMQDPFDGGVYNKCTNAAFDGMVMPGVTTLPRYVVQKGTAATLDFAAVMAQAARILQEFNKQLPGLADSCKTAAGKAWQWAVQHPAMVYDQDAMNKQFQPPVTTGGYGDRNFTDEWFWAACELYTTTRDDQYKKMILQNVDHNIIIPSWNGMQALGYYTLLRHEKSLSKGSDLPFAGMKQRLLAFADGMITNGGDKAFQTIMGQSRRDFIWGSTSVALNQSILLINAWLVSGDKKYITHALSNLDYVLGRNATGYCFVTGLGSKSPMHPHHRPSVADGIAAPVPGLIAGGPNPGQQDRCAGYPSRLPAESFLDHDCSYASNEIAINWNAPLAYVANAFEAVQYRAGFSLNIER